MPWAVPLSGWIRPNSTRSSPGSARNGSSAKSTPWWIVAAYANSGDRSATEMATKAERARA